MVVWLPKFWRMDGKRQTGSSLSRVLDRMQRLGGPHGMYGTVFGELIPESTHKRTNPVPGIFD